MIDFTNAVEEFNNYKGSEKKKTLIYNNKKYLVKFPDPIREKNKNISYINNAFSEYIGSHIFEMSNFETQNTLLGIYNYNGKEKIVCACEDFTDDTNILYEFENLALSTNPDKKIETELNDIMEVIEESNLLDSSKTKEMFWNMFVIDSLIGNTDRHNGNWGFLVNKSTGKIKFSPIYDCGSCLFPQMDEETMKHVMNSQQEFNTRIYNYPTSQVKYHDRKINYYEFLNNTTDFNVLKSIKKIAEMIQLNEKKINDFIQNEKLINPLQKEFYCKMLNQRNNLIIQPAYKRAIKLINENNQQ